MPARPFMHAFARTRVPTHAPRAYTVPARTFARASMSALKRTRGHAHARESMHIQRAPSFVPSRAHWRAHTSGARSRAHARARTKTHPRPLPRIPRPRAPSMHTHTRSQTHPRARPSAHPRPCARVRTLSCTQRAR
eukprot:4421650-Pleurochrysis_carterae.AAC.1